MELNPRIIGLRELFTDDEWNSFPQFDLKDRMGGTGYIDILSKHEIDEFFEQTKRNFAVGYDKWFRPFIIIKIHSYGPYAKVDYWNNDRLVEYLPDDGSSDEFAQVIFQRYTNNTAKWVEACIRGYSKFMGSINRFEQWQHNLIYDLIKGKKINLEPLNHKYLWTIMNNRRQYLFLADGYKQLYSKIIEEIKL